MDFYLKDVWFGLMSGLNLPAQDRQKQSAYFKQDMYICANNHHIDILTGQNEISIRNK